MKRALLTLGLSVLMASCSPFSDDCTLLLNCETASSMGGAGGSGGQGGVGGTGGSVPCDDACVDPAPFCNEITDTCVACLGDDDCSGITTSHCGATNVCQACTDTCTAQQTCDLASDACVDTPPSSLGTCEECSNDRQCETEHRCVPMEFQDAPHGNYCLKQQSAGCGEPYSSLTTQTSVNGEPAESYCTIAQTLATCEAVRALANNWTCTTDAKCMDGDGVEMDVLGAVCEQVGALPNRCTYECSALNQCSQAFSCGNGDNTAPGWCGG